MNSGARLWQGPTLVLDSATAAVQTGVLGDGQWTAFAESRGEALENIFSGVQAVLEQSELGLSDLRGFALGIGPGSILGLRLALIALQTWQKLPELQHWQLYQFSGLRLRAQLLSAQNPTDAFNLVSDFRRGTWHHLSVTAGTVGPLEVLDDTAAHSLADKVYCIPSGRGNQEPPSNFSRLDVSLQDLPTLHPLDWASQTGQPELYLPSPPRFKKWTPHIHRQP